MKVALTWILLLLSYVLVAQTHVRMSGTVVDRKSKAPLPYANISIKNSSIGTVSNEAGAFEFFVPMDLKNDTLTISYIGYKTYKESVSNSSDFKVIYLEESPIELSAVTISSEGARKLVEEALKAIPFTCPVSPYLMEGFHRSWERVDFTDSISYPGTLIEAAVTIYDPGYGLKGNKSKEEIYLNEIRRSSVMANWDYRNNTLKGLLDKNLVRYNREPGWMFIPSFLSFPNDLVYEWAGTARINDENLSVIKIEAPNAKKFPAAYKVYISEEDHAILRFELSGTKSEIDYSMGPWHTERFNEVYIFKRYNQRIYLSYVMKNYVIKNLEVTQRKVRRSEEYYMELLINNVITSEVEGHRKSLSEKKSKDVSLAIQTKEYNETFWKNYNLIRESPLDQHIVEYFEQNGKIESSDKSKKKK